jgi:hypothetical protein
MVRMHAYLIDAGEREYTDSYLGGELGEVREKGWMGAIVYASSRGQAKSLFVKHHNQWPIPNCCLEWTDKMSICLLAYENRVKWIPRVEHVDQGEWNRNGSLTKYGMGILYNLLQQEKVAAK